MRSAAIISVVLLSTFLGALFYGWLRKKMDPRRSGRRSLVFLLLALLFIFCYTASIVWLVRLIFGKPS